MEEDNNQNQSEEEQNQTQEQAVGEKKTPKGGSKTLMLGLIVLVVAIIVAAMYYKSSKNKATTSETMEETSEVSPIPSETGNESETIQSTEEVRDITVEGSEFSYNPTSIDLAKGESVRLTFKNVGTVPHNLVIDELGVTTKTIDPGESDTVEFTATDSGSYTFYCSVDSHRARGMEGELMVE